MKSPAFSLYVRDWLCSQTVSKLHSKTLANGVSKGSRALGAYVYLLCNAWLQEPRGTLPCDDHELADLAKVGFDEWIEMKPLVMLAFKQLPNGRWFNERQMEEHNKQQNRSTAGSKGGSKKQANKVAALEYANEIENAIEITKSGKDQLPIWKVEKNIKILEDLRKKIRTRAGQSFDGQRWSGQLPSDIRTQVDFLGDRIRQLECQLATAPQA